MAALFNAASEAAAIHARSDLPVLVAASIDDGEGGVFIQLGYQLSVEDAEYVAAAVLRDIRRQMEADPHPCDACDLRLARIVDALEALERDGSKPTGLIRERH